MAKANIEMRYFIWMRELFLDAQRRGGWGEGDAVDLPLGKGHVQQADVGCVIDSGCGALLVNEHLELLLGSVASSFFITRSVRLLLGEAAPGLERFAYQ